MTNFKQISFLLTDFINDQIVSVSGMSVSNLTATQLATLNPGQFYIKRNTYGEPRLCSVSVDGQSVKLDVINGEVPYTVSGENFEIVNVIGGHPSHPVGRPK